MTSFVNLKLKLEKQDYAARYTLIPVVAHSLRGIRTEEGMYPALEPYKRPCNGQKR